MGRKHHKDTTIWIYATWKDKDEVEITGLTNDKHTVVITDPTGANMMADELLTTDANIGQNICAVADGSEFRAGWQVTIKDDSDSETNTIASISGNELTMTTALSNTYTVLANGHVYKDVVTVTEVDSGVYYFKYAILSNAEVGEWHVSWQILYGTDKGEDEFRFEVEE